MRKFSILAGAIGSTAAWYILSNKQLRTELGQAKTPEETIKILSGHLGRDASKIGNAVHDWIHSDEVQEGVAKAKKFAEEKFSVAKLGFGKFLAKGKKMTENAVESVRKKAA